MRERIFALLIHDRSEPFDSLRRVLRDLSIETYSVETCKQAKELITQCEPQIVFTASSLADGSWATILRMAEDAGVPLSVVVVGAQPDSRLNLSVIQRGAFDFVAPPFNREPLDFMIRSAAEGVHRRREASAQAVFA
jgi:DNA-binding NtrC family response regulator